MLSINVKAAAFAFDIAESEARAMYSTYTEICVRPSQFGRFVAERYRLLEEWKLDGKSPTTGMNNTLVHNKPVLVKPTQPVVDLSKNRHTPAGD